MFLKPVHVKKDGKRRTYWKLVESYRTARGPRHRTVAYIGELAASQRSGWARLGRTLTGQPEPAYPLFAQLEAQSAAAGVWQCVPWTRPLAGVGF